MINDDKNSLKLLSYYSGLGLQLAAAMCFFGWLGWWLDSKFTTSPWLMALGLMLGATGGIISMIKAVTKANDKSKSDKSKN